MFQFSICLILMAVVLLLTPESIHAQDSYTNDSIFSNPIGQLCCPEDNFTGENGCLPLSNSTAFTPRIIDTASGSNSYNVSWENHSLECRVGYEAKAHSTDSHPLILDGNDLYFKYTKHFCVSRRLTGQYAAVTCHPNEKELCANATCVRKCCDDGQVLTRAKVCKSLPVSRGQLSFDFQTLIGCHNSEPRDIQVLHEVPICKYLITLEPDINPKERFCLLQNGLLYLPAVKKTYQGNEFCVEYEALQESNGHRLVAKVCLEVDQQTVSKWKNHIYATGLMVSAVFLLMTILFHIFIPKLRDMQGFCLLSHMISLLVADVGLFVPYIFNDDINDTHCVINGFIVHYAHLAAFFWLNVMCYDIWRVIRLTVEVVPLSIIQASDRKRLAINSAYAWGGPSMFTIAAIILHNLPYEPVWPFLRPGFGALSCWLSGDLERFVYFYGVVAVLLIANIFMLGHTILMLYQAGAAFQCCRRALITSTCNSGHIAEFCQRFSLFSLMALCWVTEILSWKFPSEGYWVVTDVINTLQGFFVFVIFIYNSKKRVILREAFSAVPYAGRILSRTESTINDGRYSASSTQVTYTSQRISSHNATVTIEKNDQQELNNSYA